MALTQNLFDIFTSLSSTTMSHAMVHSAYIGGASFFNMLKDVKYPSVMLDFPVEGSVGLSTKVLNLSYEVHDRLRVDTILERLEIAAKVETIAHQLFQLIDSEFNELGWTVDGYTFLTDLPETKDYNVMCRVEFTLTTPRDSSCYIPTDQ